MSEQRGCDVAGAHVTSKGFILFCTIPKSLDHENILHFHHDDVYVDCEGHMCIVPREDRTRTFIVTEADELHCTLKRGQRYDIDYSQGIYDSLFVRRGTETRGTIEAFNTIKNHMKDKRLHNAEYHSIHVVQFEKVIMHRFTTMVDDQEYTIFIKDIDIHKNKVSLIEQRQETFPSPLHNEGMTAAEYYRNM